MVVATNKRCSIWRACTIDGLPRYAVWQRHEKCRPSAGTGAFEGELQMKKDFAGVALTRADFERLAVLCLGDPAFPRRYEDWQRLVAEGEQLLRAAGQVDEPVTVNIDFFAGWCRLTGVHPCLQALRAMLIIERTGAQQGLQHFGAVASRVHVGESHRASKAGA